MDKPQTLANHAKYDPAFHFFLIPVLAINVIVIAVQLFRTPGLLGIWLLVISLALLVASYLYFKRVEANLADNI